MPSTEPAKLACRHPDGLALLIIALLAVMYPRHVLAAGLVLYETGAPDLGTAGAGHDAMAADASTAGANPAGMTLLDRSQLLVASGAMLPVINRPRLSDHKSGRWRQRGQCRRLLPLGSGFYVYKLSDRFRLGVAARPLAAHLQGD
jgi:long-chain fatty acid transport protein